MPDDIVRDFMRRYRKRHPELSGDRLREFEIECRQAWGGARVYVCKDPPEGKAARFAGSLAAGASLREAIEAAGLSPRGGYAYRFMSRRVTDW